MSRKQATVLFLTGPTAVGKTELAVALSRRVPCGLISVDSAMVYRGLDIGTAKPDKDLQARVPHRLIDICDPAETYSAARFQEDARREIADVLAQGQLPLLVGGTGLYFRALEQGLAALPAADPVVRAELAAEAARDGGWAAMHDKLSRVDAESARRIHVHDAQRIQRALEVWRISNRPLSVLIRQGTSTPLPWRIVKIVLSPPDRGDLHRRIERRLHGMMERGFLDEVQGLFARPELHAELPAMRLVGYRQAWRHLQGDIDLRTMQEHIVIATRQLAKRQLSWWRGEPEGCRFDPGDGKNIDNILSKMEIGH